MKRVCVLHDSSRRAAGNWPRIHSSSQRCSTDGAQETTLPHLPRPYNWWRSRAAPRVDRGHATAHLWGSKCLPSHVETVQCGGKLLRHCIWNRSQLSCCERETLAFNRCLKINCTEGLRGFPQPFIYKLNTRRIRISTAQDPPPPHSTLQGIKTSLNLTTVTYNHHHHHQNVTKGNKKFSIAVICLLSLQHCTEWFSVWPTIIPQFRSTGIFKSFVKPNNAELQQFMSSLHKTKYEF
jgi:hypothetical protein